LNSKANVHGVTVSAECTHRVSSAMQWTTNS